MTLVKTGVMEVGLTSACYLGGRYLGMGVMQLASTDVKW
jgi:hypothetical protein